MKKIFAIVLVASAFFTTSAVAQRGFKPIEKQVMIDSLQIPDATADSVIALRQHAMEELKTIMTDESLSQEQKREKIKPLREEMKTELKKYLTDEQITKLQEMEMSRRSKQE